MWIKIMFREEMSRLTLLGNGGNKNVNITHFQKDRSKRKDTLITLIKPI